MKLSEAMQKATAELAAEYKFTPREINGGWCDEWAERVKELCPRAQVRTDDGDKDLVGHFFIKHGILFYDSECPEGVLDYHELPIFVRAFNRASEVLAEIQGA